ncbi:unnamed protein product [marine sediment metagenome]|uniref:Uncharacterized protein n=1 Tax=marine sediment metagenome TaxID=412755 RepID=X1LHA6_9ZZZZ
MDKDAQNFLLTTPQKESQREESNLRPTDYESVALPTELRWPYGVCAPELIENIQFNLHCQGQHFISYSGN